MCSSIHFFNSPSLLSQSTWTGAGDGVNWSNPANWDSGIPAQIGDANIPLGMTATIDAAETIDWTIGDLTGGGTLINEGKINLNTGGNKIFNARGQTS